MQTTEDHIIECAAQVFGDDIAEHILCFNTASCTLCDNDFLTDEGVHTLIPPELSLRIDIDYPVGFFSNVIFSVPTSTCPRCVRSLVLSTVLNYIYPFCNRDSCSIVVYVNYLERHDSQLCISDIVPTDEEIDFVMQLAHIRVRVKPRIVQRRYSSFELLWD